jgi:HAD superfamily hydrolase (TIGR01490 family)
MAGLALFDMDGTLIDSDSDWLYLLHRRSRRQVGWHHVLQGSWWYVQHRLGWFDAERIADRALRAFTGIREDDHAEDVAACYRARVQPRIAPDGRDAVAHHHARGDRLAIVTAASTQAAAPLARELGIAHVIASELAVDHGRLTGKLARPLCYGAGKLTRCRAFAAEHGASLADATFYTDSISDLPLLEAVGRPVAVNPDRRLRRLAVQRGWPVEAWFPRNGSR